MNTNRTSIRPHWVIRIMPLFIMTTVHARYTVIDAGSSGTVADKATHQRSAIQQPLVWGSWSAAIIATQDPKGNSGRSMLALSLAPSGWGLAYAGQRIDFRSSAPAIRVTGTGWISTDLFNGLFTGTWGTFTSIIEPKDDRLVVRSVVLLKEFHGRSPFFRPCFEAGPAFVRLEQDVVRTGSSADGSQHQYFETEVRRAVGVDLGVRGFLTFSRFVGIQGGVNHCFNSIRSYTTLSLGLSLGLVRTGIR